MNPNMPIILKGEDAKVFKKYQKRKPAQDEIDYSKESTRIYQKFCPTQNSTTDK